MVVCVCVCVFIFTTWLVGGRPRAVIDIITVVVLKKREFGRRYYDTPSWRGETLGQGGLAGSQKAPDGDTTRGCG